MDHVEVALVDGQIDRFADGASGMVEPGRQVGELDEVAEVLDRAVPSPIVEVTDERRSVRRREDGVPASEHDVVRRIARDLGELPGRGRLDQRTAEPAWETHALAVDVGAGSAVEVERVGRIVHLDPDLLEDRVGVRLERREPLLAEHLERRE